MGVLLTEDNQQQTGAPPGVLATQATHSFDDFGWLGVLGWSWRAIGRRKCFEPLVAEASAQGADGPLGETEGADQLLSRRTSLRSFPEFFAHGQRNRTGQDGALRTGTFESASRAH